MSKYIVTPEMRSVLQKDMDEGILSEPGQSVVWMLLKRVGELEMALDALASATARVDQRIVGNDTRAALLRARDALAKAECGHDWEPRCQRDRSGEIVHDWEHCVHCGAER